MREFCSGRQAYYLTGRRTLQNEDGTWFHLPPLMCLRWLAFIQSMSTFRRGGMLSDLDMWWIDPFFKSVNNGGGPPSPERRVVEPQLAAGLI